MLLIENIEKGPSLPELSKTPRLNITKQDSTIGGLKKDRSMASASFMRGDNLHDVALDPRKYADKINF